MLIPLSKASEHPSLEVGEKALQLSRVIRTGLTVPTGYVLGTSYFHSLLEWNGVLSAFNELISSLPVVNRFEKLKRIIADLAFPAADQEVLGIVLDTLGGHLAVRSSSSIEDRRTHSNAGLFTSVLDVQSLDPLTSAILTCLGSAFTPSVFHITGKFPEGMAVILQAYYAAQWGGVAFSCDPLTGADDVVVVNITEGGADAIVDGGISGRLLSLSKYGPIPAAEAGPNSFMEDLRSTIMHLETQFDWPVDLEWIHHQNTVMVLQARPVTTTQRVAPTGHLLDADDIAACSRVDLGPLLPAHLKWLNKKAAVRATCKRLHIDVPRTQYLIIPPDAADPLSTVTDLLDTMRTPLVELYDGVRYDVMPKHAVPEWITQHTRHLERIVLRVQEFQSTTCCGYATRVADGTIYVETIPGMFRGFWVDGLQPTRYVLSADGAILREDLASFSSEYGLGVDGAPALVKRSDAMVHALDATHCREIARLCDALSHQLGEIRLEWIFDGHDIQYFDLSEESQALRLVGQYLSEGSMAGEVVIMHDMDFFDSLFGDYLNEIDVTPQDGFKATLQSDQCQRMIHTLLNGRQKPVVVASFPKRTLAILADYVSGFIFERGALLCHLGIILRERHIPAMIVPNASRVFTDRSRVVVHAGTLHVQ